jgi:16S rRNA (uracil1498-N3)-methyltransferase
MGRFYVGSDQIINGKITVTGDEHRHLYKVLRTLKGDTIVVFDDTGSEYICVIEDIGSRSALLEIKEKKDKVTGSGANITLYQAIPKGDKMDYVIQKSVELGVCKICPVITKRVVSKIDAANSEKRLQRWNRISKEASKQSERSKIVTVADIMDFNKAIDQAAESSYCIFPYEKEEKTRICEDDIRSNSYLSVFIGPEGGFDDAEVEYSRKKGIIPVTLGSRILRTETAPLAVLSILMYIKGEI